MPRWLRQWHNLRDRERKSMTEVGERDSPTNVEEQLREVANHSEVQTESDEKCDRGISDHVLRGLSDFSPRRSVNSTREHNSATQPVKK
jgi:hypothetical protein